MYIVLLRSGYSKNPDEIHDSDFKSAKEYQIGGEMIMKRVVSSVIALAMSVSLLGGCGEKDEVSNNNSEYKEHYTYTINVLDGDKPRRASYEALCEKFNVDFDIISMSSSDWLEKVRIWMAAGDMPDILQANIQNFNYSEFVNWAKEGLLRPMGDISKYPNVQKCQDSMESNKFFIIDGERYAYQSPFTEPEGIERHYNYFTFMYRRDWAEELGLAKDDDVYTWEEFIEIGKGMNHKLGKIGLVGSSGTFPHFAGMMQCSPYWEQYVKVDGTYKWGLDLPETLEGIKMARRLYDEGVLWKDQLIANGKEGNERFRAGEAGICFEQFTPQAIQQCWKDMEAAGIPDVENNVRIMTVKAPNGKFWGQESVDYFSIKCFNPDMEDDKFDRLMQIYDYMNSGSEEVVNFVRYGVEGKDYTIDENGIPKQVNPDSADPVTTQFFPNDRAILFEDPSISEQAIEMGKKVLNANKSENAELRVYDYPLYFFSAPNKDKYGLFYEDGRTKIKQIILSSDDIEGDWEAWKASVRDKVDLVLDELNSQLK